jgi:hypothetical protein
MGVIGALQLILDQHKPILAHLATDDVRTEGADALLGPLQL